MPGPGELLIQIHSVALNPADYIMRDTGLFVPTYPAIIGFDLSGLVVDVGEGVPVEPSHDNAASVFQPGITRVAAYGAGVWRAGQPDYGAFQEMCLVPWQHAVRLPEGNMSFNQAATLPVAVQVALNA